MIGSSASVPAGNPSSAMCSNNSRAIRIPFSMRNESSMSGSLMSPFQPSVVRGFSKYTRMMSSMVDSTREASSLSRPA